MMMYGSGRQCILGWTLAFTVGVAVGFLDYPSNNQSVSYAGHSVVRVWPDHAGHVRALSTMYQDEGVEFWRRPSRPRQPVDIRVSPHMMTSVLSRVRRSAMKFKVTVSDLQAHIDRERRSWSESSVATTQSFNLSIYHTFEEVMSWMDAMALECGPMCATVNIGTSYEGRDLKVMRLGIPQDNKPIIWIDAGIHAREWIAPATALYLIEKLVREQDSNFFVRYLLNQFVWYILSLANPDGYAYTWTTDRMWRKTRSVHAQSGCVGADPNRNWDYHWAGPGTSGDPCSENFRGTEAFSEPETRAISRFLWSLRGRLKLYLTLHSYGQYWLTPWGFTYHVPEDYSDMMSLGRRVTDTMQQHAGTRYRVGASSRMLYLASGGSDDWAKGVLGVKYSYTVELRDTGEHGFVLPSSFIAITGEEMFAAIRTLALHIVQEMIQQQRRQPQQPQQQQDSRTG